MKVLINRRIIISELYRLKIHFIIKEKIKKLLFENISKKNLIVILCDKTLSCKMINYFYVLKSYIIKKNFFYCRATFA